MGKHPYSKMSVTFDPAGKIDNFLHQM